MNGAAERTDRSGRRKVAVVGAGAVGATFAFALAQSGLADEIVLIDKNEKLARGQALDLVHGRPFFPATAIRTGGPSDYEDARVIVVTAGAAQRPGESRLDLLRRNAAIVGDVAGEIAGRNSPAVMVMVTNPVDLMTLAALRSTGWEKRRVIGSGTVLDSARLRHLLSERCGVDVHNIHAYVLGEHGDSEFAAWSMTHVAGMPIDRYCSICGLCDDGKAERERIMRTVRDSAYHIIDYKGATSFAVGLALVKITGAILRGQNSVLTVSTLLEGEFGLGDVCLSVPCLVSRRGVEKILVSELPPEEREALHRSAEVLRAAARGLEG